MFLKNDKLEILKIFEKDGIVMVLVKSNTKLHNAVDKILDHYFKFDNTTKILF